MLLRFTLLILSFACASTVFAAPPEVPKEIKARPGQLVRVVAKGEGEIGSTKSFNDDDAFFDELVAKPKEKRFVFQSDKPGVYFIAFWAKGEVEGSTCVITVGDGKPGVPPVKPPVDPPVTTALYFLIVRPDGPAAPSFTKMMGDPAWATLTTAGHKFKDKTATEAAKLGFTTSSPLPTVILLREGSVGSEIVGQTPFPTTASEVLDLPKKAVK